MKRLFLLLACLAPLAFWACSDKEVAGISTVETENAFLIQIVREDSKPAVGVVARMRSVDFVQSVSENSGNGDSAKSEFFEEFKTDSLGQIRIDSLAVDVATIEIVDAGEGLFTKISAKDIQEGDSVQYALEKTGSLRGKVYLPDSVDYAWVQVYGTDRLVKTDSEGFYEMDSLPPYEYDMRVIIGDSVVEQSTKIDAGEDVSANVRTFEPDSVKVLDFESASAQFTIKELGISETGYMSSTDTSVKTTPEVEIIPETRKDLSEFIVEAGADREGNAIYWETSAAMRGSWSFYGIWICKEESPCDLSATDSIVYYARGTGVISIILETLGESNTEGKTLAYDTLKTDEWQRRVIKPENFKPRDDLYGNLGWEVISENVTTISIAAYDSTEFWIDDVVFYGIKPSDFTAR